MLLGQSPEAIDTRLIFRVYTWIAALGAVSAVVVAVLIVRSRTPSMVIASTLGLAGALSLVLAGQAAAFSTLDDPIGRLRGLKHFSIAHLGVGAFLWLLGGFIGSAIGQPDGTAAFVEAGAVIPYRWLAPNLFIAAAVLLYLAYTASPGPRFTATMRSTTQTPDGRPRAFALREKEGPASVRHLRSQYEEQIRQAARQEERARLARDLHDAVKQQLFVIQTAAATVQARFEADPTGAREAVDQVRTAALEAMTEMQAMLDQLQAAPVENIGLVEALKRQCEALGFRTGATVGVDVQPLPPPALLPPGAQQAIFRFAQEALANIGRHARARHVTVRLVPRDRHLVLEVADDGAGIRSDGGRRRHGDQEHAGARARRGRAFRAGEQPRAGTTVVLSIPFAARSSRTYLLLSVAFASALVICGVLVARGGGAFRPWWIAAGWIAAIGTVRYAVALYRVHRQGSEPA